MLDNTKTLKQEGENADNLGSIHCLYSAKAVPMNGAPSSNADKAAFRRSAGKCAGPIPAKNCANAQKMPSGPKWSHYLDLLYFLHEVQFSAAIEAAHFPDCETGY